jgi:hypothetical protein
MDPRFQIHSELVLEAKEVGKLTHCDLVLSLVYQPYNLLTIRNKVKSGIELTDNLFVPIILEAHHLGHLQLVTSCLDLIEVGVAPGFHPFPINTFGLYHGLLLEDIDRSVLIGVEEGLKAPVGTLLATEVIWGSTGFIDGVFLCLL